MGELGFDPNDMVGVLLVATDKDYAKMKSTCENFLNFEKERFLPTQTNRAINWWETVIKLIDMEEKRG